MVEELKLLKQPDNSRLCGQTCLAMILGITIEEAIREFGHDGCTHIYELEEVLTNHQYSTTRVAGANFSRGICRLRSTANKKWSHFAVMWDGVLYDPWLGIKPDYPEDFYICSTIIIRASKKKKAYRNLQPVVIHSSWLPYRL